MSDPRVTRMRQAMQEVAGAGRELAPMLYSYQRVLQEQGFTPDQSFSLVRDLQGHILAGVREGIQRGDTNAPWPEAP
jgi:hypothetical protein